MLSTTARVCSWVFRISTAFFMSNMSGKMARSKNWPGDCHEWLDTQMKKFLLAGCCVGVLALAAFSARQDTKPPQKPATAKSIRAFGGIQPRISPDGSTIAFSYQGALWLIPRTGGTMTRLTDGPGFDIEPAWSPDGKRIAFVNSANTLGGELRLIDVGGKPIPLS